MSSIGPPADHELPVDGARLGRYVLVRQIGHGGMGGVFEAIDTALDKRVALKVLRRSYASHAIARERFLLEARVAAKLRHPHVVDVTDVGEHEGVPFLAMEYLEGEGLDSLLERRVPLSPTRAVEIFLPILAALAQAHEASIVHRDVKPSNVFLAATPRGEVPKLLDFGISKPSEALGGPRLTSASEMLGTPWYMAPEQLADAGSVDARTDVWSMGTILYECLVGQAAFPDDNIVRTLRAVSEAEYVAPRRLRPELPREIEDVMLRAMSRSPDDRFASALDFGAALMPFAGERARMLWEFTFGAPEPSRAMPIALDTSLETPEPESSVASVAARLVSDRPIPAIATRSRPVLLRLADLRASAGFADFTDGELEVLCATAPAREWPTGSEIWGQGADASSCVVIASGEVEIVRRVDGVPRVLGRAKQGAIVGHSGLVDAAPRGSSLVARRPTVAMELGRDAFERLLESESPLGLRIHERVAVSGIRQLRRALAVLAALTADPTSDARSRRAAGPSADAALAMVREAVADWDVVLDDLAKALAEVGHPPPSSTSRTKR